MKKSEKTRDLGMSYEEAVKSGKFLDCYQIAGKFYTERTVHTAPSQVRSGQCPICGADSWDEHSDFGQCSSCGFAG